MPSRSLVAIAAALSLLSIVQAQGGSRGTKSPFSAPDATVHYAPDRSYDLQNLVLDFNVDYPNRLFTATATNTLVALRDGVTQLRFHAGESTKIDGVELNGQRAQFTRDEVGILVACPPTKAGEKSTVTVRYHQKKSETPDGRGTGGWHWHEPKKNDPYKMGFLTNGETSDTRDWAVTWDYPNDFTTTETRTTVPKDWTVIGNGLQISDKPNPDGKTHTVVWRMTQPHATYLTSLVAGPLVVQKDTWRGIPILNVAPRGMEKDLEYTVEHTKDMLSFYSDNLGVKYPWPKYAQDFTYDFGGGQENVSATTFGLFFAEPRGNPHGSDWILAHEMGHQWFGDLVTCKDWGEIWLNESFATTMEMSYAEHSRGVFALQREMEENSQGYFEESKRYKRPMETNFYENEGVMFDQHTYPKGGVLLTSLRKLLGDKLYYAGINRYLTEHRNSPVETSMLENAMTDATGINLHPWFDQWIHKPGHPVIEWTWVYDEAAKVVHLHVKQTQDTSQGTPIYDVPTHVAAISAEGKIDRLPIHLNAADQTFDLPATTRPDAVVFDPDHDFLREIKESLWSSDELPIVARYAPNCIDRQYAFDKMLAGTPTQTMVLNAVRTLEEDKGIEPAILNTRALVNLKRDDLREFWQTQLAHENFGRRADAVDALAMLTPDSGTTQRLRSMINDKESYVALAAAIRASAKLDFAGSAAAIEQQAKTSQNSQVRGAALRALLENNAPNATDLMFAAVDEMQPDNVQRAGVTAMAAYKGDDPRVLPTVRRMLASTDFDSILGAVEVAKARKMKEVIPDLEAIKKRYSFAANEMDKAIAEINKP